MFSRFISSTCRSKFQVGISVSYVYVSSVVRCQELGALLLLCLGRLEEQLLLCVMDDHDFIKKVESSKSTFTLPVYPHLSEDLEGDVKLETSVEIVKSSGLIFTDALTSLIFAWTRKKHPQVTERFFRYLIRLSSLSITIFTFRSLVTLTARFLPMNVPLGILATPFAQAAAEATKIFVCRELLSVDSEFCLLEAKSINSETRDMTGLIHSQAGNALAAQLLKWNGEFEDSLSAGREFTQHFPILRSAIQGSASRQLLVRQALFGWVCATQASRALVQNRLVMASEVTQRNNDNTDDGKSDAGKLSTKDEEEMSLDLSNIIPIPSSCQHLRIVQKTAKVAFEQQVTLTLGRYAKIFQEVLQQSELGAESLVSANTTKELKSLLEEGKEVTRATHRRKRRRKE